MYNTSFVTARSGSAGKTQPLVTKSEETAYRKVFPRSMQGVWTSRAVDCRLYQRGGTAALKADSRILWIEIAGDTMRGADSGQFIRSRHGGVIEMTNNDGSDFKQEVTLVGDVTVEVKIEGARASAYYEFCKKP